MNTYTKLLKLKKGTASQVQEQKSSPQSPDESEQPNNRTTEQPNDRTVVQTEQPNNRTVSRKTQSRKTERASYELYSDQVQAIRRLRAERELGGEKMSLSEIVREAIDVYLKGLTEE